MSELDDKLRDIVKDIGGQAILWQNSQVLEPTPANWLDYDLAQIKQAFLKQYWLMPKHPNTFPDPLVMTGQEWYERFVNRLEVLNSQLDPAKQPLSGWMYNDFDVKRLARDAAGLDT